MNLDLVPIGAVSISPDGSLEAMHLPVIRTISSKLKYTIVLIIGKQQERRQDLICYIIVAMNKYIFS